jgi:hypothetical protein
MAAHSGKAGMGLYRNGCGESGTDENFTGYNWYTADKLSGDGCFAVDYNVRGSGLLGEEFVPVDTSKYYYHSVSVKTYQRSYNNRLGSGHLGFACYDKNKNFIDLRNCGGVGNTYLSRAAAPGDTVIYLQSGSGWYTGSDVTNNNGIFRHVLFFPASHPDYGKPHEYTRFNYVRYTGLVSHSNGDWMMTLDRALPDFGGTLPVGTPISRGVAGGTYNYCHGSPNYPETWTTYTTAPFTGENRNSVTPFRYGTKYIKFLNLRNYNYRSESGGEAARYLIDNVMLVQAKPSKSSSHTEIKSTFFNRRKIKWLKGIVRIKQFYQEWRQN